MKKKHKVKIWVSKSTVAYEEDLRNLQVELLKLQNHVKEKGLKVVALFEGRDAAGKGGTIKRITEGLSARGTKVIALEKPTHLEASQWYFQRYIQHLPSAGELVLFDRSWYNRAGVEPVMGFCTPEEHKRFLKEVPCFEQMLVSSGIILLKFYFSVSKKEQAKRFESRITDPLKQYKISPVDMEAQKLWGKYSEAKYLMLHSTHTDVAPWTIIKSDDKKAARINCIKHILLNVDYPNKNELETDPKILLSGSEEINNMSVKYK